MPTLFVSLTLALLALTTGARAQVCADPTRTLQTSGAAACHLYDGDPTSCAKAWAVTQSGGQVVSCFYVSSQSSCQGCGSANQTAGVCNNTCAVPLVAVDALPAAGRWLLAAALLAVVALGALRSPRSLA